MAVLSVVPALAWAGAAVDGLYQGDVFGAVSFRYEGDRLVGTAAEGGVCGFGTHQTVLEGKFQGNVLVGEATVCQGGPNCGSPHAYPVLMIFNPEDNVLSGMVRLGKGCESPALGPNGLVVLKAATRGASVSPRRAAPAERSVPLTPSPSPTALASAEAARKPGPEALAEALAQGQRALAAQDAATALPHFELALALDARNTAALVGRGASQLALGQARDALVSLERARELGPRQPEPHFWLAGAHLRLSNRPKALESLKSALRQGWFPPEGHRLVEAELRLLESGPELAPWVKQARGRKRAPARMAQGTGSATP